MRLTGSLDTLRKNIPLRHTVSEGFRKQILNTFARGSDFFQQSDAEKNKCRFEQEMGYRPFGVEYSVSPLYPDLIESFSVSKRVPISANQFTSTRSKRLYGEMISLFERFEAFTENLVIDLANLLGGTGAKMRGALSLWSRLQLNYAAPSDLDGMLINELHEDGTLFSITCATQPGLELQIAPDEFVPAFTRSGEVIVMPGEIAWLLSGGLIPRAFHRVQRQTENKERLALIFFADLDPNVCEPWISNEINKEINIGERVILNVQRFGLTGFTLPSVY